MEIIDIYDANKQKTGRTKIRNKERIKDGEFALATKAIIINSDKKVLISKRAENKATAPGLWEINGGCCQSGEEPSQTIVREVKEELGLDLSNYKGVFFKVFKKTHVFIDVWLYKVDIDINKLNFLDKEVEEARWVTFEEYEKLNDENKIHNYKILQHYDYERCVEILFGDNS